MLTPDEVRRIGVDQAITLVGNRRPLLLAKRFYRAPPNPAPAPSDSPASALGPARAFLLPPPSPAAARPPRRLPLPEMPPALRAPLVLPDE